MIGNIFSAGVLVGKAPEIRSINGRVQRAVAESVVGFQPIQNHGQAPILLPSEALESQCVGRALFPREGWLPLRRASGRNVNSARRQRVAVMKLLIEVQA